MKNDLIFKIYKDNRSVYRLSDIALLLGESDVQSLSKNLNYYVHSGKLLNPRKGIYAKSAYDKKELICILYTPSYISLEYVLQKAGIIFQYDSGLTAVSYLSRELSIDNQNYRYRKIKGEILINTLGIQRNINNINIATPERAFLDMLYLNKDFYFDNINSLNKELVQQLIPIYSSKTLQSKVDKLF